MKASYLKVRLTLGTVSLAIGLLAANFALFEWRNPDGFFYLLGEYAHYACAYGGFAAIISGAMLINDFIVLRTSIANKHKTRRNANAWLIRARTEWQLAMDFEKFCSMEPELPRLDFFFDTEEDIDVVTQL